jgi:PiT family inorganic phosphate transporter
MWWIGNVLGGGAIGGALMVAILAVAALVMYLRSRRDSIGAHNVNDDWQDTSRAAKQTTNA